MTPLAKIIEALLFLSPEPVSLDDLRDATQQDEWAVLDALTEQVRRYAPAGGFDFRKFGHDA